MATILLTGFNGFQGHDLNPSWEMLRSIPSEYQGHDIVTRQVKTEWEDAGHGVVRAMREVNPDLVLSFGLAGSNGKFMTEALGTNNGTTSADNAGIVHNDLLDPDGPVGVEPTIPAEEVVGWLDDGPIGGFVNHNAGGYLCNHVCYVVGRAVAEGGEFEGVPFVFNHVMAMSEDVQYSSSYQKHPIRHLAESVAAIVRGAALKYFGTPVDDLWGPVAPEPVIVPQIAEVPRKGYFDFATEVAFRSSVFALVDNILLLPSSHEFGPAEGDTPPTEGPYGWTVRHSEWFDRDAISVKVFRESDGAEVADFPLVQVSKFERFYGDNVCLRPFYTLRSGERIAESLVQDDEPHIIEVSVKDLLGDPFTRKMRLSFTAGEEFGKYEIVE